MSADDRDRRCDAAHGDRNAGRLRRGERRTHSGHHHHIDSCLDQSGHLLAAAAENERVATLEPDDVEALPCEGDHHRVDLVLTAAVAAVPLAGIDDPCVVAAEAERGPRDQRVVQDHVGGGEEIDGLQREQAWIAWSGADERNTAIRWRTRRSRHRRGFDCERFSTVRLSGAEETADLRAQQSAVCALLAITRHAPATQSAPRAPDQRRQRLPFIADEALQARTQRRRDRRALTGRGDRHAQRTATHDRGRVEVAVLGTVDDVEQHTMGARFSGARRVRPFVLRRVDRQRHSREVAWPVASPAQRDSAVCGELLRIRSRICGNHRDRCAAFDEATGLLYRDCAAA